MQGSVLIEVVSIKVNKLKEYLNKFNTKLNAEVRVHIVGEIVIRCVLLDNHKVVDQTMLGELGTLCMQFQ